MFRTIEHVGTIRSLSSRLARFCDGDGCQGEGECDPHACGLVSGVSGCPEIECDVSRLTEMHRTAKLTAAGVLLCRSSHSDLQLHPFDTAQQAGVRPRGSL